MDEEHLKNDETEVGVGGVDNGKPFPFKQLFYLALCRIAEPVALTLVFPYSYEMMKFFGGEVAKSAGLYAGLFLGAFSLAEMLTAFLWGGLSDKVGRKPVLLLGCAGTVISMLIMGFSTNIYMAILGRAIGGGLNGNIGVVQTMVSELVRNPKHEPRAYTIMPIFYQIGVTIGPAIGGYLAEPEMTFPNSLGKIAIFRKYPYLLPNLACIAMLLVTGVLAATLLEETHPKILERRRRRALRENAISEEWRPLLGGVTAEAAYITDSSSSRISGISANIKHPRNLSWIIWNPIIGICILTSHTLNYIQLIPVFIQRPHDTAVPKYFIGGVGGLNLPLYKSGQIMAVGGLIALLVQVLLFPYCTSKFGLTRIFAALTFLHPLVYFTIPYVAFVPPGIWRSITLYTWLTIRTIFSVFPYPILLIFVKRAATPKYGMGRVNGVMASAGAGFRTLSPPIAGWLQTLGERHHISALAWWGTGLIAIAGTLQCWSIVKQSR